MAANNLPKPLPSSTVPYHRNPDFVDTGILREIEQKLAKPASRVGLFGLGGMGYVSFHFTKAKQLLTTRIEKLSLLSNMLTSSGKGPQRRGFFGSTQIL